MSEKLIKNIEHATPLSLKELVQYDEGKVASMTLAQETGVGITVFAFDAGEGVSTHSAQEMPWFRFLKEMQRLP